MEYQKQYNKNHIQVNNALQTNGYSLDEEWCAFFRENHFLIGVSLDGLAVTHNAFRHGKEGGSTHEQVLKSITLLKQYNVDFNILTVVTGKTAESISSIYQYYKKQGWNYQQYIACMDPLNEKRGQNPYSLTPVQYGNFLIKLFSMWHADYEKGKQLYIRQFDNYLSILIGRLPEACDQRGICSIQYMVEADGSVYPCDFYGLDEYCLGNLNQVQLDCIDEKRIETDFIARSRKIPAECRTCRYSKICRGGCMRNRDYEAVSDTYKNYYCEGYQMFFDHCLPKLQTLINFKH